ncbi:WD40 repeat domain-containing protein [Candidatus Poribacteria bacterium]|nr:WD40 repeat domain-containing protein [Candidatus Poribacteria bacterium]
MKTYFSLLALVCFCFCPAIASGQSVPEKPTLILGRATVRDVAYSLDGKLLATAVSDGIHLYEAGSMKEVGRLIGPGEPWCIAFSPNGKLLASTCVFDQTVQLWDMVTKRQIGVLSEHQGRIWSLAFSSDSRTLASGSADGTIRLWDVDARQQTGLLAGHMDEVYPVAFSPDARLLASGGKDNTVRIWDVQAQKQLKILQGHNGWVHSLAFSPDGAMLASGGGAGDGKIRLWEWDNSLVGCRTTK